MTKRTQDELHVLERIMYMLEERSVSQLAETDVAFGAFVEQLYAQLDNRALHLVSR